MDYQKVRSEKENSRMHQNDRNNLIWVKDIKTLKGNWTCMHSRRGRGRDRDQGDKFYPETQATRRGLRQKPQMASLGNGKTTSCLATSPASSPSSSSVLDSTPSPISPSRPGPTKKPSNASRSRAFPLLQPQTNPNELIRFWVRWWWQGIWRNGNGDFCFFPRVYIMMVCHVIE